MVADARVGNLSRFLLSRTSGGTKVDMTARDRGVGNINADRTRRGAPVPLRGGSSASVPETFDARTYGFPALWTDDNATMFWDGVGERYYYTWQERGTGSGAPQAIGEAFLGRWTLTIPVAAPVSFGVQLVVDGDETETTQ